MHTWADLIRDLQTTGLTQREIGDSIGLSTSAVSDIANGRTGEPGGTAAMKLHRLHGDRCVISSRQPVSGAA